MQWFSFNRSRRCVYQFLCMASVIASTCSIGWAQADPAKPLTIVAYEGTPTIDGEIDDIWKKAPEAAVVKVVKSETSMPENELAKGKVQLLWDKDFLYALWQVKDAKLSASSSDDWAQDSIELFVDEKNQRAGEYQEDDAQYRVSYEGKLSGAGMGYDSKNVKAKAKKVEGGYVIEMSVKLSFAKREVGTKMGLDLQINDDPNTGSRGGISKWNHPENDSYQSTSNFGTVVLEGAPKKN